MRVYIGIDDTDNLETRGTGFQARSLGVSLMDAGLLDLHTITRHQLLVDRRIPFTSHNSSAGLVGESNSTTEALAMHCKEFLLRESAFDSDAGLCIAEEKLINKEVVAFGMRAKREIVTQQDAMELANKQGIYLEGFLNTEIGVIGSLAAVGLRSAANDGRLLWMKNLRETSGVFTIDAFKKLINVERVLEVNGHEPDDQCLVNITEWCRPVMNGGFITLFVEQAENNTTYEYQSASKEFIKSISE